MTEQEVRKGGGGKLSRSETVTVRLDPKLRYLAELAARLHRRTLSSYVEWAIKASLDREALRPLNTHADLDGSTIGGEAEYLWDVDDADRFAKLALRYPHLLTHEEQVRWKLIRESPRLWAGRPAGEPSNHRHRVGSDVAYPPGWEWTVDIDSLLFEQLRAHWSAVCDVAAGVAPDEALARWLRGDAPGVVAAPGAATDPPR